MSFVATITANIDDFSKNLDKAGKDMDKFSGDVSSKVDKTAKSFASIAVKASIFATAVTAAAAGLVKLATIAGNANAKINNLSTSTSLSTDVIQELSYVATASNSSFNGLTRSIDSFQRRLKSVDEEGSKTNEMLAKLGVSTTDAEGNIRSMDDVLLDTFKGLGDMENGLRKNAIGTELFGRSWNEVALIVSSGSKGIESLRKEANDLGLVLDGKTLKSSDNFATAMGLVGFQVDKLKTKLGASLVPILENTILPLLQDKVIPTISKVVESIARGVENIISKWGDLVDYFTFGEGAEMWETIRKAAVKLKNDLTSIFKDIEGNLLPIWDNLGKELSKSFKQTSTGITSAINFIVETFDNFLDILRAANPKEALDPTKKFFVDFANGIKDGLSPIKEGAVVVRDLTQAQLDAMGAGNKWGATINEVGEKTKELTSDLKKLSNTPLIPQGSLKELSEKLKSLYGQLDNETTQSGRIKVTNLINDLESKVVRIKVGIEMANTNIEGISAGQIDAPTFDIDGAISNMNANLDNMNNAIKSKEEILAQNIQSMNNLLVGGFVGMFASLGDAIGSGENVLGALGKSLIGALGDMAIQVGTLMIGFGGAAEALWELIASPMGAVAGIAAGAALIALGAAAKSAVSGAISGGMGGGGYSSGGYQSTRVEAPMQQGEFQYRDSYSSGGQVEFKISGDSLVGVLDKKQTRSNRNV